MNAEELIEFLEGYPGDTQIIMSKDSEGNNFTPLDEAIFDYYAPENEGRGELTRISDPDAEPAIVLWPIW